jgi:hypothetical protein
MLGLLLTEKSDYGWYGRSVGDYPLPAGTTEDQLGKNATWVISVDPEKYTSHEKSSRQKPYELGLVADPNNPGCFVPMYDYFNGGYGLDARIGSPVFANKDREEGPQMLAPKLKQTYDMCCDKLAAVAVGDKIEFLTLAEAAVKYPTLFPKSDDTNTWVSVTDTDARVQTGAGAANSWGG